MANTYVYPYKNALYINLTNRCSNDCDFCLRRTSNGVGEYNLWLDVEPDAAAVLAAVDGYGLRQVSEVVFCGFGEPTMALPVLLDAARGIRARRPDLPIRINTNGQANLIHGRDVTGELAGLVDIVSVSLNAPTAEEYDALCHPEHGPAAFDAVLDFCRKCAARGIRVTMSVIDTLGEEKIAACRKIAGDAGATLRVRPYIG